jgi:hypothetical protein
MSRSHAEIRIKEKEKEQLAEIIAKTLAQPSRLDFLDTPLPSATQYAPASRQAFELWRFRTRLEEIGYTKWAQSTKGSIDYIKSQNRGLPPYD